MFSIVWLISTMSGLPGEQDANQERMIDYYNAPLQAYTCEVDPERFAAIQRSLGIAYRTRTDRRQARKSGTSDSLLRGGLAGLYP